MTSTRNKRKLKINLSNDKEMSGFGDPTSEVKLLRKGNQFYRCIFTKICSQH